MQNKGYTHIYFGDGKGKTTAALGLAIRAAGHEQSVVIVQFLKNWNCGETKSLRLIPNVTILRTAFDGGTFVKDMSKEAVEVLTTCNNNILLDAIDLVRDDECDLLILDEAIDAYELGVLDENILLGLLKNKPEALELIITGHNKNDNLLPHADYITEMKKQKHPFDTGIEARKGIEF